MIHALVSYSLNSTVYFAKREQAEREKEGEQVIHHNPENQARKLQQAECNNLFKLYRHLRRPQ